jgi:WD40 repeat protein
MARGLPTPPRPSAIATLERADGLWIALGSGSHVWITRAETSTVYFLEPIATAESKVTDGVTAAAVSCLAFCRTSELLAVGAGADVALYEPSVDLWKPSTLLPHADAVSTLTWATDELSAGSAHRERVLWVAGNQLARWRSAGRGAEWVHTWSCTLSQPARLMSASVDGAMLATAGPNDKLVKVWQQSTSGSSDGFDFYYLRHPGALLSLEWRPTERQPAGAASMRTGSSESEDSAFLLTLCADGVPRLWRATMSSEPGPRRMFLCAVFSMDGCSNIDETSLQLVQWLPPTTRPAFPRASPLSDDIAGLFELDQGRLSPRIRPSLSPLLTPAPGVPILKPSQRDRHDYFLGQLADGTMVVWLLTGLSTERRCSPKLMVWATLPHRLPAVAGVQSGAAFCNTASTPQRADQLPSTISVVQHTRGISSHVRLCSMNVELAAANEGVHLLQLLGHGPGQAGEIVSLKPHPVSSLAASLSAEGELLLWHSPTFSWHDGATGGRNTSLRDASRAPHASPTCLMHFPERYEVIVWVPASAMESASLIALRSDGACLFGRNSIGAWNISCSVPILFAEATMAGAYALAPGRRWICAHALATKARSEASCIAFQAERAAALVWTVSEGGHSIRERGHVSLKRESSSSPVRCSAPLVAGTWDVSVGPSLPMGAFICGHEDGTICMWSLDETTMGLSASLRGVLQPAPSIEVSSVATSWAAYMSRAAVVLQSPVQGSTFRMQILEFESGAPSMRVEFESEISSPQRAEECKRTPSCAIFAGACGMHTVAVSSTNEVTLYLQRGPREHDTHSARWAPLKRTALPGHLPCTALAWTVSGTLLVGSSGVFFTFPNHFATATSKWGTLSQWHPIALRQQLLVQPERCHRVLRHLSVQPQLAQALPLDLAELLLNDDGVPGRSPLSPAQKTTKLSAPIEDIFAPTSSSADMFAPTQMAPDFLKSQSTSLLISGSAGGCSLTSEKVAARLLERLEGIKHPCMPHLSMAEEEDLVRLLRAQKAIDAAGPAIDACGARFVLCALERPRDAPTRPLSSMAVAWAMLSDCHTTLLEVSCAHTQGSDRDWAALRALGVGFWLPNGDTLRAALEAAAKVQFTKKKEALDCALLYIALGKTKQLQALSKATKNDALATFLANDFTEERWLSAARKNAYSVLSKQQYEFAIALFLLGGDLDSAVNVCARQLQDVQLALVLCRLHPSAGDDIMRDLVRREVLPDASSVGDHWLCCICHVLLAEPDKALVALEMQSNGRGNSMPSACGLERLALNPCAAAFCALLIASPRWRLTFTLRTPRNAVFLLSAYSLATTGCWLLALETLLNGKPVEAHNAHVRSACQDLALRYLADRSSDLFESVTAMSISTIAKALHEARTILVQEAQLLGSHLGISIAYNEVHSEIQPAYPDPVDFLPSWALFTSLRMWEHCTNLLESTLHAVEQRLSCLMPHEQSDSSAWLSKARSSLLAALCTMIDSTVQDVPSFDAFGSLAMRIRDAAHHAAFAIACSQNDFVSVLEVLRGRFTNEIGSSKTPDLLRTTTSVSRSSSEVAYVWIRFHLCALPLLRRHSFERYAGNADSGREQRVSVRSAHDGPQLLHHWLQLLRQRSRETVRHLSESSFPLDPAALCARGSTEMSYAVADAWNLVSGHDEQLRFGHQFTSPNGIWPLENEQPEQTSRHLPRSMALGLSLGDPQELFHRKGEFIRAICENSLNPCQIAVSLGRGVLQLELSEKLGGDEMNVAHSIVSETSVARCLCAHPKLSLYLAGGESVVQCWSFGPCDQNDQLRAQYKLPAGGRVANIRISPLCSEQFASIDDEGFVSLWRFQSGGEMPLPYNRLQSHMKRGCDICYVDSSVILASVGLSSGSGGNSLCLWDILLPPSQALVASCAAHPEGGRCVVHCSEGNSLISGGDRGEVVVFDLRQRKLRECWRAHPTTVHALTLAHGRLAFSADAAGNMKLWDVSCPCIISADDVNADGRPIGEWRAVGEHGSLFGTKGGVHSLFFSSTTRFLLSGGGDGRLLQWPIV